MARTLIIAFSLLLAASQSWAQEPAASIETSTERSIDAESVDETEEQSTDVEQGPKTMSGMSILGNEEAPKSLVIIPWKSSELGEDISLTNTLDDRAQPVDRDVFTRELRFYKIRSGEDGA